MTESHKLYDGEEISEEQADADLARYQNMLLNDDSGFVPFAEYEKKSMPQWEQIPGAETSG